MQVNIKDILRQKNLTTACAQLIAETLHCSRRTVDAVITGRRGTGDEQTDLQKDIQELLRFRAQQNRQLIWKGLQLKAKKRPQPKCNVKSIAVFFPFPQQREA